MNVSRRVALLLVVLVGTAALLAVVYSRRPTAGEYLSSVLSIVAVLFSLLLGFKSELWPFELRVLVGDVMFASAQGFTAGSPPLVLPVSFLNSGSGDGVVEWVAAKVIDENAVVKLYIPVAEIDLTEFMRGRRLLHAENTLGAFVSFPIHSKESVKKHILFTQEEKHQKYPFNVWAPGKYVIEVYVKALEWKAAKMVGRFDLEVTGEMLQEVTTGMSSYVSGLKIDV